MKTLSLILCAATLVACSTQPVTPHSMKPSSDAKYVKQFQAEVESIRKEFDLPGITAAYILSDGSGASAASGLADVETKVAIKDKPRMLAASIGKTYVGALAVSLASEGKLDLDKPVATWLGKYDWFARVPNHDTMTVRHLLTHSAGLPDHVHLEAFQMAFAGEWRAKENAFPPQRLIGFVLDKQALFPAGKAWSYSDTGYLLVGMIIEEVTGNTYYDEIGNRFLKPLGLADTSPSNRRALHKLATGYMSAENPFGLPAQTVDQQGRLYLHPGIEWTGGGLVSTSENLARWGNALYNGNAISSNARSDLFNSVPVDPEHKDIQYGAGVAIIKASPVGPVLGHAGWIPGYISSLRHYSEKGITIAFQINTDTGAMASVDGIARQIEQRLLQSILQPRTK